MRIYTVGTYPIADADSATVLHPRVGGPGSQAGVRGAGRQGARGPRGHGAMGAMGPQKGSIFEPEIVGI